MVRALSCFSAVALFTMIGCVAQTDGAADTDTALGSDGPPPSEISCTQPCVSRLPEHPVITCMRGKHATVSGKTGSLYDLLVDAANVANVHLRTRGKNYCGGRPYDCAGDFYTAAGKAVRVPPFNSSTMRTDDDLKRWKASVASFYRSTYLDPHQQAKLADGEAAICTTWALVHFQSHPEPSIESGYTWLAARGSQSSIPNVAQINAVFDKAFALGCGRLLPAGHDMDSSFVAIDSELEFDATYGECGSGDPNVICPQPWKNFMNAHHVLDLPTCPPMAWFVHDPTGGCGMSCYSRRIKVFHP